MRLLKLLFQYGVSPNQKNEKIHPVAGRVESSHGRCEQSAAASLLQDVNVPLGGGGGVVPQV
jgi:hypothetical protein